MTPVTRTSRIDWLLDRAAGFPDEPPPRPRLDPVVVDYELYLEGLYVQAEDETRGYMTERGCREGARSLFYSRRPGLRPWRLASEELRRAWSDRKLPRPLYLAEWRAGRTFARHEIHFAEQVRL